MKYPQRFTLHDRGNGYEVDMKYDSTKGVYLADYGDGMLAEFAEDHVDGLIEDYYDVVEHDKKVYQYPDSFQFTHDTTSQIYNMVKLPHHTPGRGYLWACTQPGLASVGSGATYTAEEIAHHFKEGHWKEISNSEPVERPLTLPFTIRHKDGDHIQYKVIKSTTAGKVDCYDILEDDWCYGFFDEEDCKRYIKEGTWIVTSVGSQKAPEPEAERRGEATPLQAPPEPSKEAAKGTDKLTFELDSESVSEARERIQSLADAVENLNIALESFGSLMGDLQHLFAPQQIITCDSTAFCFEDF